jgi:glycosyltransferase domain-containing protein
VEKNFVNKVVPATCTIVIPLKDNPQRTKHFLKNNLHKDFDYLFADGSYSEANHSIFADLQISNIKYLRCAPDQDLSSFLAKMRMTSELVQTKYVFTMDAGDYLVKDSILMSIRLLQNNPKAVASGGNIYMMREFWKFCTRPYLVNEASLISNFTKANALEIISHHYLYLWYAVQETEIFKSTWLTACSLNLKDPFLEYVPTISILANGMYIDSKIPQLIRIKNSPRSWTKRTKDMEVRADRDEFLKIFSKFSAEISALYNISEKEINIGFWKNFTYVMSYLNPDKIWKNYPLRRILSHYKGLFLIETIENSKFSILRIYLKSKTIRSFNKLSSNS